MSNKEPERLTDRQQEIVDILRDGRATPDYIAEQTDIDAKQTIQYHLRELRARRAVRRVHTGLYELDPEFSTQKSR